MSDPEHEAWLKEHEEHRHKENEATKARVARATKVRNDLSSQKDRKEGDWRKKKTANEDEDDDDAEEEVRNEN